LLRCPELQKQPRQFVIWSISRGGLDSDESRLAEQALALAAKHKEPATLFDHHKERSGAERPTSLEQIFRLLGLPQSDWTRWMQLVAANDRGHLEALQQAGASPDEMREIRAADRRAQGITADDERAAQAAINHRDERCGGRLTVVRLAHERASAAADLIEPLLGGPGYQTLLVSCPKSVSFYGSGPLVKALANQFPNGYWGGNLPRRGYWGGAYDGEEVARYLMAHFTQDDTRSEQPEPG
jgi:hypothetical protein